MPDKVLTFTAKIHIGNRKLHSTRVLQAFEDAERAVLRAFDRALLHGSIESVETALEWSYLFDTITGPVTEEAMHVAGDQRRALSAAKLSVEDNTTGEEVDGDSAEDEQLGPTSPADEAADFKRQFGN